MEWRRGTHGEENKHVGKKTQTGGKMDHRYSCSPFEIRLPQV